MNELEPPQRESEDVLCCCVLIHHTDEGEYDVDCSEVTSGPDDPFCSECSTRHHEHPGVIEKRITVTARMREKVES